MRSFVFGRIPENATEAFDSARLCLLSRSQMPRHSRKCIWIKNNLLCHLNVQYRVINEVPKTRCSAELCRFGLPNGNAAQRAQEPGRGDVSASRHGIEKDLEQAYAIQETSRAERLSRRNAQTAIFRRSRATSTLKIMATRGTWVASPEGEGGGEIAGAESLSTLRSRAPSSRGAGRAVAWHEREWLLSEKRFRGGQRRIGIVDQRKTNEHRTIQNKIIIIESTESSN